MAIRTDLLTQVDWRHYQPPQPEKESHEPSFKKWFPLNLFTRPVKKSSAQETPAATEGTSNRTPRTIAQDWPLRNKQPIVRWRSYMTM